MSAPALTTTIILPEPEAGWAYSIPLDAVCEDEDELTVDLTKSQPSARGRRMLVRTKLNKTSGWTVRGVVEQYPQQHPFIDDVMAWHSQYGVVEGRIRTKRTITEIVPGAWDHFLSHHALVNQNLTEGI